MPPHDFGIPDSYVREGGFLRLFERPDDQWSIEDGEGIFVGTLVAYVPDVGEAEWAVLPDGVQEPDGYWPSWRRALDDFVDTLG
jgi:hypothetical protein